MRGHRMDLWREEFAGGGMVKPTQPRAAGGWGSWRVGLSSEGWKGVAEGRVGKVEALWSSIHARVREGREPGRVSALGPSRLPSIMPEAAVIRRKGRPSAGPVYGRLLHFLEGVIGWKEARSPSLRDCCAPHSLTAQSRLCWQEALRLPFLCTEKPCLPIYFAFNSKRSSGKTCG